MNTTAFLDSLVRDLRHGLRGLRRNPMFTAVALLTLAIGIGANTAVFSVVNSVLLKPLPYPNSEQLVAVSNAAPGGPGLAAASGDLHLSLSMYVTYADQNRAFQSLGVWDTFRATVTGIAEPEELRAVEVSDGALQALAVPPVAGRWLSAADSVPNGPRTVMLSYGYWQRRFGGDPTVIGRTIQVDSNSRQIVGVMPEGFRFVNADFDLIEPLLIDRGKLHLPGFGFDCVARLKPGVTIAAADADIARLYPVWRDSWPMPLKDINPHVYDSWRLTPAIRPLKQVVVGNVSNVLWVLLGMIGIVMLIAAANVANLSIVRVEARHQELAIRTALGAGTGQIVRALLAESFLLALFGGALGVALANEGLRLLLAIGPGDLPRLSEISLDARALGFALVISFFSALLFGLFPAIKSALGSRISVALRAGGRSLSQSRERRRARSVLVVAQVALALVLLISSGLMIRTFQSLRHVDPGFTRPEQLQLTRISIPPSLIKEPERVIRVQNDIRDKLAAIPGVTSVAFGSEMPMESADLDWDLIIPEGKSITAAELPPVRIFKYVSPGFFATQGTPLVAGRDYSWTDIYGRRHYAIVSENLARELWGSPAAALGKRFNIGPDTPWQEVIGVVRDVREKGAQEAAPKTVYWPVFGDGDYSGQPTVWRYITFAIRTDRAGTRSLLTQVSQAVWSVNASLPLSSVQTMQDVYTKSLARTSFTLVMLGIAGAMALALGIIGIYGVISYTVSQRRREIGIRVALGAQQAQISQMFFHYAISLSGIGVVIGLLAAAGLMRLMKSLLFGISTLDPLTYVSVPLILVAAAMLASYLPARRAAATDPVEALRSD
ncbi:MAG: ABC transporter permease [Candidatus Acidiferrales bacterium]